MCGISELRVILYEIPTYTRFKRNVESNISIDIYQSIILKIFSLIMNIATKHTHSLKMAGINTNTYALNIFPLSQEKITTMSYRQPKV